MDAPQWNLPPFVCCLSVLLSSARASSPGCANLSLALNAGATFFFKNVAEVLIIFPPNPLVLFVQIDVSALRVPRTNIRQRCTRGAHRRPELSFELCKLMRWTNDFSQAIRRGQIAGVYFLLITNGKTSEAFYKPGYCLCPATCYSV